MYAVLWLALDFDGSNWQNLVSVALGAGVFLLLPKKWITGLCGGKKGVAAVGSIVNRNRSEMASRLYSVSRVFYDMSDTLRDMESAESGYTPENLRRKSQRITAADARTERDVSPRSAGTRLPCCCLWRMP